MSVIKVIVGSSRPGRFALQPAEWIMKLSEEHPEHTFELVDLATVNLPLLDEPVPALYAQYSKDHTKAWSKVIAGADGFIFITPEYNHAAPPVLVNSINYLAAEWRHKPVAFVSYGVAGGVRAVENLRVIVGQLSMYSLYEEVNIINYWAQLDDQGTFTATTDQVESAHKMLKAVTFWADTFKGARQQLSK